METEKYPNRKGKNSPSWKGGKIKVKCRECKKDFLIFPYRKKTAKYCSRLCSSKGKGILISESKKGHEVQETTREKISITLKEFYLKNPQLCNKLAERMRSRKGKFSPRWKGGLTSRNIILHHSQLWREWREKVFKRDDYTCQFCWERGGRIEPHHIRSWKNYPRLRFKVSNGMTLCKSCHKETKNYGNRKI